MGQPPLSSNSRIPSLPLGMLCCSLGLHLASSAHGQLLALALAINFCVRNGNRWDSLLSVRNSAYRRFRSSHFLAQWVLRSLQPSARFIRHRRRSLPVPQAALAPHLPIITGHKILNNIINMKTPDDYSPGASNWSSATSYFSRPLPA